MNNATLDDVLITDELERRPTREPDYVAENRALNALLLAMNESDSILYELVSTAMRLCRAESAGISILESDDEKQVFRWHAISGAFAVNADQELPLNDSPCGVVLANPTIALLARPERHFASLRGSKPLVHEALLAPFYSGDRVVGTLWALLHSQSGQFLAEDARLLSGLARVASTVYRLDQAQQSTILIEELDRRVTVHERELSEATAALRKEIVARTHAEAELRECENQFRALVHATSDALYRMSPDWSEMQELQGGHFINDTTSPSGIWLDEYIHPADQAVVNEAIRSAVETRSVFELEHRVRRRDGSLGWTHSRAVPLLDQQGELTGWFGAASDVTSRRLAEESLRESERHLSERVEHATAELRSLSRQLIQVQEAERQHIAYELHDEIGQALTGLRFSLDMASHEMARSHLLDAIETTEHLADRVRSLTLELRPPALDDLGLLPAVLALTERITKQFGVSVDFQHEGADRRFSADVETSAYRVVQEALTNVARHSSAEGATVRMIAGEATLSIWISDRGRGFSPNDPDQTGRSSGLAGMRERARYVGGMLTIDSQPGSGTTVALEIPVTRPSQQISQGAIR